ncbi:MAG: site-2 protease family protein [Planctomycetaceae bacterium]
MVSRRETPLFWSFSAGSWFGVRVRVSWWMPLVAAWFLFEFGPRLGGALFGVLVLSTLLHEFGHILAARLMDGSGDEILIWPLGGLAFVDRGASLRSQFVTALGGPVVNLLLCLLTLPAVLDSGYGWLALNPIQLPMAADDFGNPRLLSDVQVLVFYVNWTLLLVNLVPAYPLDGGRMARCWLASRTSPATAAEISLRVAFAMGIVLAVLAMFFLKSVTLLGIAFLLVILALQESFEMQNGESYEESFMGYDFSQGYTSLEREEQKPQAPARPGLLARWREMRRVHKQLRLEQEQRRAEQQLDELLAKVHARGLEALTPAEQRLLKRASDRFRSRDKETR